MIHISCGLKITSEIDDNILLGKWELDTLTCYFPASPTIETETYEIKDEPDLDVVIEFIQSELSYTVSSVGCTSSATGFYTTEFDGSASGEVDFRKILTASTCTVNVPFVGASGSGSGDVEFTLLGPQSTGLYWEMNNNSFNRMELDFFTGFQGSNQGGFCEQACKCVGTFDKI